MENNILKHRMAVINNIAKSFGYEKSEDLLEKAEDNDIEKAKHQDGDMHPNGKWVWRASANGGKGDWRVASPSKRGGGSSKTTSSAGEDKKEDSKTTKVPAIKHQVDNFMYTIQTVNSKFTDESKVSVVKTDKGNWDTYYDGKRVGIVNSSVLSEKVAKEKGWLKEDDKSSDWFYAVPIDRPGSKTKPLEVTYHHLNTFVARSPDGKNLEIKRGGKRLSKEETEKFAKVLKEAYKELGSYEKLEYYTLDRIERELKSKESEGDTKKSSNTVTHDINGTKVTVTKNSDGSYTLEANGKKVKSDDPSFFVNGTNLKPRVKAALAKEVGLETKKITATKKMKVPSGKKVSYEDDIVAVYDDKGKKVYEGMLDYSPYQLDDSKWNEKDKNYDLPKGYKMVGK